MKKIFSLFSLTFQWTWKILRTGTAIVSSLLLFSTIGLFLFLLLHQSTIEIPDGSALVLAPRGNIVEKRSPLDLMSKLINNMAGLPLHEELLLQDAIKGIRAAANDKRIKLLVIAPDQMGDASLNQLHDIGRAIEAFKNKGKVVIALGDNFSQAQYYLASWGDEIYLNPMGAVSLHGFGLFRLYMREMLDKLSVDFHIFKVGTFKSALEPFIRNNMSPEAKQANLLWLTSLWDRYCSEIADHRGITVRAITTAVNRLAKNMQLADGDSGQMALNNGLVDGLKTRIDMREYLKSLVGSNSEQTNFNQVDFNDYLTTLPPAYTRPHSTEDRVGIIVARGNIVYGEAAVGQIGSDNLTKQISWARRDPHVKALVLRIDSGGGSAFASELIRQELLLLKKAGKPVIISMGSMAASGAYWIAADADKIFAAPTTLTGSIGIFGALPTFEKSLARAGIFNDGIGTTDLAGAGNPTRALPEKFSQALQSEVEWGYRKFITIVAHGRHMPRDQVEKIAEGRVWDGSTALKLGLVDQLGSLEDAVSTAAKLTGLPRDRASYIREGESPAELILKSLGSTETLLFSALFPGHILNDGFTQRIARQYDFLTAGDPQHMYSHCLLPRTVASF